MAYDKEEIIRYLIENTPMIFDMNTNDLQYDPRNINYKIYRYIKEFQEEIERLNNIINNFKKDIEVIEQIENIEIMKMQLRNIAFRLKGSDKE